MRVYIYNHLRLHTVWISNRPHTERGPTCTHQGSHNRLLVKTKRHSVCVLAYNIPHNYRLRRLEIPRTGEGSASCTEQLLFAENSVILRVLRAVLPELGTGSCCVRGRERDGERRRGREEREMVGVWSFSRGVKTRCGLGPAKLGATPMSPEWVLMAGLRTGTAPPQ